MTKTNKKASDTTKQLTIFDLLKSQTEQAAKQVHAGSLNFRPELCAAMSEDIRHAHDENGRLISRFDVVARMSNLLNYEVQKSTLDNWTAVSHDGRVPDAIELAAFVRATNQRRAIECVSRHAGIFALPGPDALRAEIQRREEIVERERKEISRSKVLLKEVEREK
jgi:hypothetical protein